MKNIYRALAAQKTIAIPDGGNPPPNRSSCRGHELFTLPALAALLSLGA